MGSVICFDKICHRGMVSAMSACITEERKEQGERVVEVVTREDITREEKERIEQRVKDILKDSISVENPSVDITKIVESDGLSVEPKRMDVGTTGILWVDGKNKTIFVNREFSNPDDEEDVVFKKSRFITAHEYGHYILHVLPDDKREPFFFYRDTEHRWEPDELEADYFARSILMPLEQFKIYYEVVGKICRNEVDIMISLLSSIFKVTRKKVRKRVEDLRELA